MSDLTNPAVEVDALDPRQLIDKFISDVLLPTTTEGSIPSRDVYNWFLQYCEHLEVAPSSISLFSRHLKKRFQHRRVVGIQEFYCILKPELRAT